MFVLMLMMVFSGSFGGSEVALDVAILSHGRQNNGASQPSRDGVSNLLHGIRFCSGKLIALREPLRRRKLMRVQHPKQDIENISFPVNPNVRLNQSMTILACDRIQRLID
jgi:hypothetical protein